VIFLDSCAVLEILFDGTDASDLSKYLDEQNALGVEIVFLPLTLLESSTVVAVRYKEKKIKEHSVSHYIKILQEFSQAVSVGDMSQDIILSAAQIKSEHAASMVDCYLIANAIAKDAEIVTCASEILKYWPQRAKLNKVTKRFSKIRWKS
jgi:predicted nucleic acid-binding protein